MGKGFDKGNETTVLFDRRHWDEREGRGGVGAWKLGSEYWEVSLNRPIPRRAPGYSSELCA